MSDDNLLSGALGDLLKNIGGAQGGGAGGDLLGMLGNLIPGDAMKDVGSIAGHLQGALGQVPMSAQAQSISSVARIAVGFLPKEIVQQVSQYAPMIQMGLKAVMGDVPPLVTGLLAAVSPGSVSAPSGNTSSSDIQSVIGALGSLASGLGR